MLDIAKLFIPFTRYPYKGRIVPCPVCEETSFVEVATLDRRLKRLPTAMCSSCGLLYTNPMPTDDELSRYYSKYYRFDYQMVLSSPSGKHVRKRNAEAEHKMRALGGLLAPGAATLDFGCGSGEFVGRMLEAGFDAHGFEPGEQYGAFARDRLGNRIRVAGWQDVANDRLFDLVSCFHVLEHLNTPLAALERIASWLAPGGKAYIEVPNLAPELDRKGFGFLHFAHVIGFNHHNLVLAASRVGMTPLKVVGPTGIIFQRGQGVEPKKLAELGLAVSKAHFVDANPYRQYLSYQKSKLTGPH